MLLLIFTTPSNKVIAQNFPSTRLQGTLQPQLHNIMPIVQMIIDSWTINKRTHTNWQLRPNTIYYNSMGALSIHLHQVFQPSKFQQLLTSPIAIIHCNLNAHFSLHRSCIQSQILPLNWPSHHHLKIKHMECIFYELFIDWAMSNGHVRNKA